jgi:hypothetical protein
LPHQCKYPTVLPIGKPYWSGWRANPQAAVVVLPHF